MTARRIGFLVCVASLVGCPTEEAENQPPDVVIGAPEDGFSAFVGAALEFSGTATDDTTPSGELVATWTSGDTELASGPLVDGVTTAPWGALSVGAHDVVLSVTDSGGATGTASVSVVARANSAPVVVFTAPEADAILYASAPVPVAIRVEDAEKDPADLAVALVDGDGAEIATPVLDGNGDWSTTLDLAAGSHTLVASATDSIGLEGTARLDLEVRPANVAPTCAITTPEDGDVITDVATFVFEGTVGDDQTPLDELTVTLDSSIDDLVAELTPAGDGSVSHSTDELSTGVHTLTLTVLDDAGAECTTSVQLDRSRPPSIGIYAPDRHSVWNDTDTVHFEAIAYDAEDDETTLTVVWESDLDGLLGNSIPLASGDTELDFLGLSPGVHVVTASIVDSSGWPASATLPIVVNGTPTAPVVSVAPDPALTAQPLVVSIDTASTDVDGDIPVYDYEWSVGGVLQPSYSGLATLPSSATTKGETWEVSVTATDGIGTSPPALATASIINTPPTVQSAYVDPPFGVPGTVYSVVGVGFSDDDGDPEGYTHQWFVDGQLQGGATAATLDSSGFPPGSVFSCEVTAWDGSDAGNTVVSATATLNTPPVVVSLSTTPAGTADEYDAIVASAVTSDPDGQTVTMQWQWHDQAGPIAGATIDTLTGADFDRGDVVHVVGTPDDGVETGPPVTSASVTIVNAPPTVGNVTVSPSSAFVTTTLTCSYSGFVDPDAGDTDQSTFEWTAGGAVIGTAATQTGGFSSGETVACNVIPFDGIDQGPPASNSVTISNRAPVLTSLSIDTPVTRDAPATTPFTATDPDGDAVSLISNWTRTRNGTSTLVAVAPSLSPALFLKGDLLAVSSAAWDGITQGNTMTAGPVTVQNSTPSTPTVQLFPAVPEAGVDDLDCIILVPSVDLDTGDQLTYNFTWAVSGTQWTGPVSTTGVHSGDRIAGANTADDEVWTCTVSASDDDPVPATSGTDSDSIEVRGCGSIDFLGSPAGLVLDWTQGPNALTGSPHPDMTLELYIRGIPANGGYVVTSYDSNPLSVAWLHSGLPFAGWFQGGAWHHVARVWDSSAGQVYSYIDGFLRDTSPYYTPYFGDLGLYIGGAIGVASGNYWDGQIAGLRLSDNVRYSSSFVPPLLYDSDANTILFVPMTSSVSGEAFDDGPSGFAVTDGATATVGGVTPPSPYCE